MFRSGDKIKVKTIRCGFRFNRRLAELGIFRGSEIEIIKNDCCCPLIVKIFDSRVALGMREAFKIYGEKI